MSDRSRDDRTSDPHRIAATARAWRLAAIVVRSRDPDALATFYRDAFDFGDACDATAQHVQARTLRLGDTRLCIERAGVDAAAYPDAPGWSPRFQHFAIAVTDMDAAMARLASVGGWRPISTHGPQRLPPQTGDVTAFKLRDCEGHPLELIAFPDERAGPLFLRIDHSAISVADVGRSIAYYERLGLEVMARSLNSGIEQSRLDGIERATVDVVGLRTPSGQAPHLELLGYRGPYDRSGAGHAPVDDAIATRLAFDACSGTDPNASAPAARCLRDPDGHRIEMRTAHATGSR